MKQEVLRLSAVTKTYNGFNQLNDFHLNVFRGEVVSVFGLRDAGQEALFDFFMGGGMDSGMLWVDEIRAELCSLNSARDLGVFCIGAHANLVPQLSIAENIFVLRPTAEHLYSFVSKRAMEQQTVQIFNDVGLACQPYMLIRELEPAQQHLVEVIKSAANGAKLIVIADSVLDKTRADLDALFRVIRCLREQGISFLVLCHSTDHLKDLFSVSDRLAVLQHGRNIGMLYHESFSRALVLEYLLGKASAEEPRRLVCCRQHEAVVLTDIGLLDDSCHTSMTLYAGEVTGVVDLSGRLCMQLVSVLTGSHPSYTGTIRILDKPVHISSYEESIAAGIRCIHENGPDNQLLDRMTVEENLTYPLLSETQAYRIFLSSKMMHFLFEEYADVLEMDTRDASRMPDELSAVDRLRVLYLSMILTEPKLLVCVRPCAALDEITRRVFQQMIDLAARRGISVLILSTDPSEVNMICDRFILLDEQGAREYGPGELSENEPLY